jgi:hypothetical protein
MIPGIGRDGIAHPRVAEENIAGPWIPPCSLAQPREAAHIEHRGECTAPALRFQQDPVIYLLRQIRSRRTYVVLSTRFQDTAMQPL